MTTTTIMKDSSVGDAWIAQACQTVPVQRVMTQNKQTGAMDWNGNILTGPVRLAFADSLLEAKPQMRTDPNSKLKFSCTVLFPPQADMRIFWEEFHRVANAEFKSHWNGQTWVGLDIPIYDASMKSNYSGFTPGCMAMNTSSNIKPAVVDQRNNPIIDPAKVYSGAWAVIAVNTYASGKNFPKKGPRFGLQCVMMIADDLNLAGQAPDPRTMFQGVNITPPVGAPAAGFGAISPPPFGVPPAGGNPMAPYYPQSQPQQAPGWPPGAGPDVMKQFGM